MGETKYVTVAFEDIRSLLVELGFRHVVGEGGVHVFAHLPSDSIVAIQKPSRGRVPALYVSAVSRMLDERGFRARAQVEQQLLAHASDRRTARSAAARA